MTAREKIAEKLAFARDDSFGRPKTQYWKGYWAGRAEAHEMDLECLPTPKRRKKRKQ